MTVVTLGAHIVDVLARPVDALPAGHDTVVVEQVRLAAAGSAAGTAVALARLGNDVVSVGAIGDDDLGDLLTRMMSREGVDVSGLVRRTADQTSASILPIRSDGGRPVLHAPGANRTLTSGAVDPGLLVAADAVHVGGPDVVEGLSDPAFFHTLDTARASGTIVTMDVLSEAPDLLEAASAFLPHVDYFLPNEQQALAMTGASDPVTAARRLRDRGPRAVVVTLGEHGSLLVGPDGVDRLPAHKVDVVDTTGCGDAYCAGFITGLLHGLAVRDAAQWGTAAAALVAADLGSGTGLATLGALKALLP
ncbi:carbohydrate kinase family protein [Actinomadura flavalba]|uniref:carbohydrate kinase family protein n=1 Tax=Actinomadura flavalba TaxID=1120938 RepID=UPI0003613327|nr:PfkB family carbohydrate kinase [Actinomadura flavalba]